MQQTSEYNNKKRLTENKPMAARQKDGGGGSVRVWG